MSAFAVFCATDGSLTFYNRDTVPTAGSTFEGKVASNVYTGFDTAGYNSASSVPWYNEMASIISVSFTSEFATVKPIATRYWFNGANMMTTFNTVNLDTSNVVDMSAMFQDCKNLTSLDLSSFNTSNVTSMANMFRSCFALTSLDLSSFNTSKVINMINMFYACTSLTSLDLSSFNTSNVTKMGAMFQNCSSLTSLDLSSFDTSNVTNMSDMFQYCRALTTIYVSKLWDTTVVTNSENMFANCIKLFGAVAYNSSQLTATMANYKTGYLTYKFYADYFGNKFVVSGRDINNIANALRAKTGSLDGLSFPDGFIAAIESLSVAATDDGSGNVTVGVAGSTTTYNDGNVVIS